MTKEEFDKKMRVAILQDRVKYGSGLISELKKLIPSYSDALGDFDKRRKHNLNNIILEEELYVPPLTYKTLQQEKPDVQQALNDEFGEQRRYDLAKNLFITIVKEYKDLTPVYSTEAKVKDAISMADKFIEYFKKKEI